jgi:hypothetical protein
LFLLSLYSAQLKILIRDFLHALSCVGYFLSHDDALDTIWDRATHGRAFFSALLCLLAGLLFFPFLERTERDYDFLIWYLSFYFSHSSGQPSRLPAACLPACLHAYTLE